MTMHEIVMGAAQPQHILFHPNGRGSLAYVNTPFWKGYSQ